MSFAENFLNNTDSRAHAIANASPIDIEELIILADNDNDFKIKLSESNLNSAWGKYLNHQYGLALGEPVLNSQQISFFKLACGDAYYRMYTELSCSDDSRVKSQANEYFEKSYSCASFHALSMQAEKLLVQDSTDILLLDGIALQLQNNHFAPGYYAAANLSIRLANAEASNINKFSLFAQVQPGDFDRTAVFVRLKVAVALCAHL